MVLNEKIWQHLFISDCLIFILCYVMIDFRISVAKNLDATVYAKMKNNLLFNILNF